MTPREVLNKFFATADADGHTLASDDLVSLLIDELKAEGLFIGPLVATPEMYESIGVCQANHLDAKNNWADMVEVWRRGEGA